MKKFIGVFLDEKIIDKIDKLRVKNGKILTRSELLRQWILEKVKK